MLEQQLPFINYIDIPVETDNQKFVLSGQYRVPRIESEATFPAVLVLHSSAGIDSTGSFYIKALNKAGIATLEVDMWGARDLEGGSAGRPETVQETLPDVFAGHVSHYPVCWVYNLLPGFEVANLTGAPVLIRAGELDGYE